MSTILIINGAESREPMATGRLSEHLAETARAELEPSMKVLTTRVRAGYDVAVEQRKFVEADVVLFQFPVFWFATPPTLKKYVDDVYEYGKFFGPGPAYGRGGLLGGRDYLVSTTWNASSDDFGTGQSIIAGRSVDEVLTAFHLTQQYVGLKPLPSFSEHDVVRGPDPQGAAHRLREHLRAHVSGELARAAA
ncbi:NAD(P)H-dependent oxidoreductase [Streptomyces parvus]|uniref:NAD(P)H-dependent oxidoreductase n=1 Tax=Streptomyces TaxID=1883 RepID=UPI000BFCDF6E|nr:MULTISPECIES: NAD(P)H-dependent oxidoreductase [unclassified Streptomyces]PVD02985.1 flavodoxin family protein [Streptomyces sp. CS147]